MDWEIIYIALVGSTIWIIWIFFFFLLNYPTISPTIQSFFQHLVLGLAVADRTHLRTDWSQSNLQGNRHFLYRCTLYPMYSTVKNKVNGLVSAGKNEKTTEMYFSLLAIYKDSC